MSALDPHQLAVARILFALPAAEGYALAGGSALLAAGVIDRPTRDVDAFVAAHPGVPPGDVGPLVAEVTVALEGEGWTVEVARSHQTFARLVARKGPITVDVDLAVDSPPLFPVVEIDGLPVLAAQDLAARKPTFSRSPTASPVPTASRGPSSSTPVSRRWRSPTPPSNSDDCGTMRSPATTPNGYGTTSPTGPPSSGHPDPGGRGPPRGRLAHGAGAGGTCARRYPIAPGTSGGEVVEHTVEDLFLEHGHAVFGHRVG